MRRKMWFNLGMTLLLVLALGSLALKTRQAQAGASTSLSTSAATLGSGFTYQGRLTDGGSPANGIYDFKFTLYNAAGGGAIVGSPLAKANVTVTEGLFTETLDFGNVFDGTALWLKVEVRLGSSTGAYTTLAPRQALAAAPYALSLQPGATMVGSVSSGGGNALSVTNTANGGRGVYGFASAASGFAYGVYGASNSTDGRGVVGISNSTIGTTYGIYGLSYSTQGYGVYGNANATSGTTYGVYGENASPSGRAVYGLATAGTGYTYGVWGQSNSTDGRGIAGWAIAGSGPTRGVYGKSSSSNGYGVYGWAEATTGNNYGVYGRSESTEGSAVVGYAAATSGFTYGVYGETKSSAGYGVYGKGKTANSGYAGYFNGQVEVSGLLYVNGNLTVTGAKSFKIDHPLDPQNKYLYHYNVESSEVVNQYTGNAVLDENGTAWVVLPAWFQALNQDFRYQITPIGAPGPNLYIAQEIAENRFQIAGGEPGMKVSWLVTALRQDPYLRDHPAQAEQDKPASEQGTYLYPAGYDQPESMGLDYQRNLELETRSKE